MDKNEQQKKEREIAREQAEISRLIENDGWGVAKRLLDERLNQLSDISTIDTSKMQSLDFEAIGKEVAMRSFVISVFNDWRAALENMARLHHDRLERMNQKDNEYLIEFKD